MGGFINGWKRRIPGEKLFCRKCERYLDESEFIFTKSKGYQTYCRPCYNEKQREYRLERQKGHKPYVNVVRTFETKDPEVKGLSVAEIKGLIKSGDVFWMGYEERGSYLEKLIRRP